MNTRIQNEIMNVLGTLMAWGTQRRQAVNAAVMQVGGDLIKLHDDPDNMALREQAILDIECLRLVARQERRVA